MRGLYHPALYNTAEPVPSYWEATAPPLQASTPALTGDEHCEVAIIGGGYTGLSAALHLARDHGIDVQLLEAGKIGWGASGRNGGLCCLAATKLSLEALIKGWGLEAIQRFYASQLEGMALIHQLCIEETINCDIVGEGNFEVAHRPQALRELEDYGTALTKYFDIETKIFTQEAFREIGHGGSEQFGALHVDAGFALHPLKLAHGLAEAAIRRGAQLHSHSEVVSWSEEGNRHILRTASGGLVRADKVLLATNAFMPEELNPQFAGRILPGMSKILTTRPLSADELAAEQWQTLTPLCNSRNLLFYYRLLPDQRLLFGARGDFTGSPEAGEKMKTWMTKRLGEVFPSWRDVEISHFWRGLFAMTLERVPAVGLLEDDPSVGFAYGYHANGVNTAPWVGKQMAALLAGSDKSENLFPVVLLGQARRFPLPALRLWLLRAAWLGYRLTDG